MPAHGRKVYYSKCLSEATRGRFGAEISALVPLANHTDLNVTPAEMDCFVRDPAATPRIVLVSVAPLKKRFTHHRRLVSWYINMQTQKQASRRMEGKCCSFRSADF